MSDPRAGIDEAGRGPALGPLVVCSLCVPSEDLELLKTIGARDSKTLTPRKREGVYADIIREVENRDWGAWTSDLRAFKDRLQQHKFRFEQLGGEVIC